MVPMTCECGHNFERPEAEVGLLVACPVCGLEQVVPKLSIPDEVLYIAGDFDPPVTSGKAIFSFAVGLLFVFACVSGIPAILLANHALSDIDRSAGRLKGRRLAQAGRILGIIGCLFTLVLLLMPATRSAREAARRSQCVNNLKQIGLAMENYRMVNGCLPPAAITDQTGKPLLSWRVALLPYLDSVELHQKFHLDEPWDSPHNLSLVQSMPSVFSCPSDPTLKKGLTGYRVVIGPDMAFRSDFQPRKIDDFFTDGTSNTILVGESLETVPWTKPDELRFDNNLPMNGFGSHHGYHNNGLNVLLADGSVRFIKTSMSREVIRAYLTPAGNEVISGHEY